MTDESPTVFMPSTSECSNKRSKHSRLLSTSDLSGNVEPNSTVRPEHSSADFSMGPDPDVVPLDIDMDINPELYSSISDDSDADGADLDPTRSNSDSANDIYPGSIPESTDHSDADSEDIDPDFDPGISGSIPESNHSDTDPDCDPEHNPQLDPNIDSDLDQDEEIIMDTDGTEIDSDMFTPLYNGANITIVELIVITWNLSVPVDYHFPPF